MFFKRQILNMYNRLIDYNVVDDFEYLSDPAQLRLIIETKTFVYSMAQYLFENKDWLVFSYFADGKNLECVSVRADEVVAISITNEDEVVITQEIDVEKNHMYQ